MSKLDDLYLGALKEVKSKSKTTSLDTETLSEIHAYARGMHMNPVYWKRDVMTDANDIEFWLKTKLDFEGPPPDTLLIETIGDEGQINRPVILDVDNDLAAEGRHRLSAALKFGLEVPIIMISRQRQKGWKKLEESGS